MLRPIELSFSPSCSNCLAWSADGELAVAAGEFVHVLTPKTGKRSEALPSSTQRGGVDWNITRFRANLFTNKEWPIIPPQNRDDFSIGAEQSISKVVGLAWSPPGLTKYRRCLLAVLTSNNLLSFYEAIGPQEKWTRVTVVNETLREHFGPLIEDTGPLLRKTNIRSFAWCPPMKVPATQQLDESRKWSVPETRWGIHILCLANGDNDLIFIHISRPKAPSSAVSPVREILTLTFLHDLEQNFPKVQAGSVLSAAVKSRIWVSEMTCGPWHLRSSVSGNPSSAVATIAAVYGTKLKTVRLELSWSFLPEDAGEISNYKPQLKCSEHGLALTGNLGGEYHFTRPLQWLYTSNPSSVHLVAGIFGGLVSVCMSSGFYEGEAASEGDVSVQRKCFMENKSDAVERVVGNWEPIGGMTAVASENGNQGIIHVGTQGGYAMMFTVNVDQTSTEPVVPFWKQQVEEFRERFDIDHDLGGLAIARIHGLASHHGIVAAGFTLHPGDMIEYRIAAEERTTVVFSTGSSSTEDETLLPALAAHEIDRSPAYLRAKRGAVLGIVLAIEPEDLGSNSWSQKLMYSAACCAIVESQNQALLSQSKAALVRLATITGADLSEEISKCAHGSNFIGPKSSEQLNGPGALLYEKCDICDLGISWYSAQEAQCASGHLFVRCGLTFLPILEPEVSKFCFACGMEYLNEESLAQRFNADLGNMFRMLTQIFETCVYCGAKFRD